MNDRSEARLCEALLWCEAGAHEIPAGGGEPGLWCLLTASVTTARRLVTSSADTSLVKMCQAVESPHRTPQEAVWESHWQTGTGISPRQPHSIITAWKSSSSVCEHRLDCLLPCCVCHFIDYFDEFTGKISWTICEWWNESRFLLKCYSNMWASLSWNLFHIVTVTHSRVIGPHQGYFPP